MQIAFSHSPKALVLRIVAHEIAGVMCAVSHGEDFLSLCLQITGMGKVQGFALKRQPSGPSSQAILGRSVLQAPAAPALQTRAASEASLSQPAKRSTRIRWNMGPCQHRTWLSALRKTGLEAEFCNLMQWRGFQFGSRRVAIKMKDFCHDKYELARELLQTPSLSSTMPETYLSVEDFVASRRNVDGLWFLKLSDVDYGCGVRPFQGPKTEEELHDLLELAFLEASQSVTALRKAKGCKPRPVGRQIVIQRAVESPLADGHKEDFRVYVCCTASSPRKIFVYQKIGVRKAPKPMNPMHGLSRASHCTHYGRITPAASSMDYRHYDVIFPKLCASIAEVMLHFSPSLEEGSAVLLGMDFICDESLKPWLLEINQVPRICYDDPHVQAWTEGMAMDFMQLVVLPEFGQKEKCQTLWSLV